MGYRSSKTYGHDIGLSACFRQWKATSHCNLLHGYALSVHIEFEAVELNETNWVMDFGALKPIKAWLKTMFDHKLLVAEDDPFLNELMSMSDAGLADIVIVQNVGCEAFAKMIYDKVSSWLFESGDDVYVHHVTVREHGANAASYYAEHS